MKKEHLTPRRTGGNCLIKSMTSEKCLDIAITATSTKSHSCAVLETFYICSSFILPIIFYAYIWDSLVNDYQFERSTRQTSLHKQVGGYMRSDNLQLACVQPPTSL